ncbi:hypothetical protein AGABI1DRAFT_81793 [Agaricus bisporus var. burnettii JB137-S8]|uniref:Thioredoxin domain-containing protein n=2 Tax=Agaricus bisporus var. burnettii TaxID=192524 RepID=K5XKM9_AGABU|nr:uncharacterized protein AGABI1DRAFT_81793 [Agaricus bisporus var. burnettii JB137-S8]EKM84073.1 hypothetical protein AGABI1DRAFT_81793 [Agaricus bisporus var. burnettii JB137-S8]KAF7784132.1 hypothetical protein Agabi119p4_297 [Agaricus bisporus var. burnettii]
MLNIADAGSIGPHALLDVPEKILIFYSSPVHGELWCPDCRDVEQLVRDTFDSPHAPDALIIYVGDKSQWKAEHNPFRKDPWKLRVIPTIVKLDKGKEVGRLVDKEISEGLATFVAG